MGRSRTAVTVGLCLVISSLGAVDAATRVSQDGRVDLGRYRLFEWGETAEGLDGGLLRTVETAIEHELAADGLRLSGREAPELRVIVHVAVASPILITANEFDHGGWPGWGGWVHWNTRRVELAEIPGGAIMVDVVDVASGALVWRALATRVLRPDGALRGTRVERQIERVFEEFPFPQE